MKKRLIKEFTDIFEVPGEALFFSPGRVNLIGEHTDYNGALRLLPMPRDVPSVIVLHDLPTQPHIKL